MLSHRDGFATGMYEMILIICHKDELVTHPYEMTIVIIPYIGLLAHPCDSVRKSVGIFLWPLFYNLVILRIDMEDLLTPHDIDTVAVS